MVTLLILRTIRSKKAIFYVFNTNPPGQQGQYY